MEIGRLRTLRERESFFGVESQRLSELILTFSQEFRLWKSFDDAKSGCVKRRSYTMHGIPVHCKPARLERLNRVTHIRSNCVRVHNCKQNKYYNSSKWKYTYCYICLQSFLFQFYLITDLLNLLLIFMSVK